MIHHTDFCVELAPNEFDYLEAAGFLPPSLLDLLREAGKRSTTRTVLELSRESSEEFRRAFTVQLAEVGFDEAYEPTVEGRLLEDLIDRFRAPQNKGDNKGDGSL
jgi:hypothetical protein